MLYSIEWVNLLRSSLYALTNRELVDRSLSEQQAAIEIFNAPYLLVSHNTDRDPLFNYANQTALDLFEMTWDEFIATPSRHSAEPLNQAERAQLLERVTQQGFIDDYTGIRISKNQQRFRITNAIVWNAIDSQGIYWGQAALCHTWEYLQ
jgi:hypothetical protein